MAALGEGREYGLISKNASCGNKTVVQLKLTDSSLRAIEEYLKIKSGTTRRPTIQFQGNQGAIIIPVSKSSHNQEALRTFQFSVSNVEQNARYEAIQQSDKSPLVSLGVMENKISVQATNEVYKTTRERITQVEEERVKVCTKEVKANEPSIGRKSKKLLTGGYRSSHAPKVKPYQARPNSSVASHPAPSNPSHNSSFPSAPSLSSSLNTGSQAGGAAPPDPRLGGGSRPKPAYPAALRPSSAASGSKSNSGIINQPFRDRIIHLLAIRPYKKPEILIKLQKDGIREKDKNTLGSLLQQVGIMNRDNSYSLARHLYGDVRVDWPYYTEADRQLLKRTMQTQALDSRCASTSPAVSPASAAVSPASSSPGWSPSRLAQKRQSDEVHESEPVHKKRISHHRPKPQESSTASQEHPGSNSTECSPDSNCENVEGDVDDNANDVDAHSESPDYVRRYNLITSVEQRTKYKQTFNTEYSEYRRLHAQVQQVTERFCQLQALIQHTEEGSEDFERLRQRIVEEYRQKKGDPKFVQQKRRFEYLHQKLAHIKKLIADFDQQPPVAVS